MGSSAVAPVADVAPFARLTDTGEVELTRRKEFVSWRGHPEQLVRLVTAAEDLMQSAYEQWLTTVPEDARSESSRRLVHLFRVEVLVTARGDRLKRSGPMAQVLAEMDLREVARIEIENRSRYAPSRPAPLISIEMGRNQSFRTPPLFERYAISLLVSGEDKQWVAAAFDTLVTELSRGCSRLGWMRRPLFFGVFAATGSYGVAALAAGLGAHIDRANGLLLPALVAMFLAFWVLPSLVDFFIPPLEVVDAASTTRGRRLLGVLAAVASLALGAAGLVLTLVK